MVSRNSLLRHLPRFDREGFIRDPQQWSESLASQIARRDGLPELTHADWLIIRALREHFRKFGAAPPTFGHMCAMNHLDRHCVDDLFRSKREAWRVAGLPALPRRLLNEYLD